MNVFISYAHQDEVHAREIASKLERRGIDCFLAPKSLRGGEVFEESIRKHLEKCRAVFLLLTPNAMKSEWVICEWSAAWALRKQIVPVMFNCIPSDLPPILRNRQARYLHEIDCVIDDYADQSPDGVSSSVLGDRSEEDKAVDEIIKKVEKLAKLRLSSQDTLYEERSGHYREEKAVLGREVVRLLGIRVSALAQQGIHDVRIVFDSGTTIAPVLDALGAEAEASAEHWTKRVARRGRGRIEIITNNLRGVNNLLKYRERRGENSDRYAEVPFDCRVLPGKILAVYQASADDWTIQALLYHNEETLASSADYYTITVTTGNYVLKSPLNQIVPIARGGLHPEIKSTMYLIADEVFLLAPLGKVLSTSIDSTSSVQTILAEFNEDLGYSDDREAPSRVAYRIVEKTLVDRFLSSAQQERYQHHTLEAFARKSILVTTSRREHDHVFFPHYQAISRGLRPFEANAVSHPTSGPYVVSTAFDDLPPGRTRQLEAEVPHANLRRAALMAKYFGVHVQ